jgi:hypothetical protein
MFLLRRNKCNSDVTAVCYVCYDITRNKIFDVKWKPYQWVTSIDQTAAPIGIGDGAQRSVVGNPIGILNTWKIIIWKNTVASPKCVNTASDQIDFHLDFINKDDKLQI